MSVPGSSHKRKRSATGTPSAALRGRLKKATKRNMWTSADDWDQVVADSALSTASVSSRRPAPYGLPSLLECSVRAAGRGFKRLWEDKDGMMPDGKGGVVKGGLWREGWEWLPVHLKLPVRNAVYDLWGEYLTQDIVADVFSFPPILDLSGRRLAITSSTTHLKPFRPPDLICDQITTLDLSYAGRATDVAIAGMLHFLIGLEELDLSNCVHAGERVVNTMLKRCPRINRLDISYTKIKERDVKRILAKYGQALLGLNIDGINLRDINDTFTGLPYKNIQELTVRSDIAQAVNKRDAAGWVVRPDRPLPDIMFDWPCLSMAFPALTHLCVPCMDLKDDQRIRITLQTLVKLDLVGDALPLHSARALTELITEHCHTLKDIHISRLQLTGFHADRPWSTELDAMGDALNMCQELETLKINAPSDGQSRGKKTGIFAQLAQADQVMAKWGWKLVHGFYKDPYKQLKHLYIDLEWNRSQNLFPDHAFEDEMPTLESLVLLGVNIHRSEELVKDISRCRLLRILDLTRTMLTQEQIFEILDHCSLLSEINLTSARGVKVSLRRNIFKAWEEDRQGKIPTAKRGRPVYVKGDIIH